MHERKRPESSMSKHKSERFTHGRATGLMHMSEFSTAVWYRPAKIALYPYPAQEKPAASEQPS